MINQYNCPHILQRAWHLMILTSHISDAGLPSIVFPYCATRQIFSY